MAQVILGLGFQKAGDSKIIKLSIMTHSNMQPGRENNILETNGLCSGTSVFK